MIKAVLFDFDGVIADTESSNSDFFCRALANHGVTLTERERIAMIGTHDHEMILSYIRRCDPPVSYEEFLKERMALGTTYEDTDIRPEPGLLSVLHTLRERKIKTAVVSSTTTKLIVTALNRMNMMSLFDAIVCGDMTAKHKPDPLPYLKTMDLLGAAPEECVVVEDSGIGISSGKAAGAFVAAYLGTDGHQDVSLADAVFRHFDDFLKKTQLG